MSFWRVFSLWHDRCRYCSHLTIRATVWPSCVFGDVYPQSEPVFATVRYRRRKMDKSHYTREQETIKKVVNVHHRRPRWVSRLTRSWPQVYGMHAVLLTSITFERVKRTPAKIIQNFWTDSIFTWSRNDRMFGLQHIHLMTSLWQFPILKPEEWLGGNRFVSN